MILLLRQTCPWIHRSSLIRIATTPLVVRREQKTSTVFPSSKRLYDLLPKSVQPYVRLSRLDKPIGSWLLFLPGAWSIAMAGISMNNLELIGLFGLGTILMRGAGCTINDLWDRFRSARGTNAFETHCQRRDHRSTSIAMDRCAIVVELSDLTSTEHPIDHARHHGSHSCRCLSSDETVHLLAATLSRVNVQLVGESASLCARE